MEYWNTKDESVIVKGTYEQHLLIEHFMEACTIFTPEFATCTITSGNDGRHMVGSRHFNDKALDFRIWGMSGSERWAIVQYLNYQYDDEDWLSEADHIHGESDPK
jgi:hypothetical protein